MNFPGTGSVHLIRNILGTLLIAILIMVGVIATGLSHDSELPIERHSPFSFSVLGFFISLIVVLPLSLFAILIQITVAYQLDRENEP